MSETDAWRVACTSALSYINFLEQNLSGGELRVAVEGWFQWATANAPESLDVEKELTVLFNNYTKHAVEAGGRQLESQERIIEAFRSLA